MENHARPSNTPPYGQIYRRVERPVIEIAVTQEAACLLVDRYAPSQTRNDIPGSERSQATPATVAGEQPSDEATSTNISAETPKEGFTLFPPTVMQDPSFYLQLSVMDREGQSSEVVNIRLPGEVTNIAKRHYLVPVRNLKSLAKKADQEENQAPPERPRNGFAWIDSMLKRKH